MVAVSGGGEVKVSPRAPLVSSATVGSQVIQGGSIRARDEIAFISQQAISMTGRLEAGNGRGKVYARVDEGGVIRIGDAGLQIKGKAKFSVSPQGEVAFIGQDEGDSPAARAPAVNESPSLSRNRRGTRTRPTGAVIASRTRSGLAKDEEASKERKRQLASSAVTPVRKRSFFRTRATVKEREN